MKQRGSAIVIAVFLVAAIGGLAFSFGRIFLIESRNASIAENGISAYYAAESGIEEGFLRYRYDRNAEIPYGNVAAGVYWTVGDNKVFRSNLDRLIVYTGTSSGGNPITDAIPSVAPNDYTNEQVYKLRMGFAGTMDKPIYGQDANNDGIFNTNDLADSSYGSGKYGFLKLTKDETYKIDLSKINFNDAAVNNDIRIMAKYPRPVTPDANFQNKAMMYAKLTVDYLGNGTDMREYKTFITSGNGTCAIIERADANCSGELIPAVASSTVPDIVWSYDNLIAAFRSQFGARPFTTNVTKVTLSLKPLFYDAYIGLSTMTCSANLNCLSQNRNNVVSGPFTSIKSTGYYGGVTRTISANIDRQSGTLYDLFDYVIYQKP